MTSASPRPGQARAQEPTARHFDALETRDPAVREAALFEALPSQLRHAQQHGAAYRELLRDVDPAAVGSRAALARLPVMRKQDLLARQQAASGAAFDPFGGCSTLGWSGLDALGRARRVHQSPGPIYEPEGAACDYWRTARALHAAGFRAGDLVHCCFSYHLTPAGAMMDSGAQALGCSVFPGGVGNTELQLQAMRDLRPHGYVGTPSFLKVLLERADENGLALPSLRKALVSGEAFPTSLCAWLAARGIDAYQCYASADLGLIAYETSAREGLVVDEGVIVEIVRPGTGQPVPEPRAGAAPEVGEVVVTTLNRDYPLIRFGTGDLSAVLPGPCPSGRTNMRLRGWLGRADQTTKVRGMFVHAGQIAALLQRHPELRRARLVVSGEMADDRMTLRAETDAQTPALAEAIAHSLRELTRLRADVLLCAPGSLPNDGKWIDDTRGVG